MKFLNIERAFTTISAVISEKFEPDIPNSFGEIFLKNPRIYKECMSSLTFFLPVILQFLIAAIFFVTDCKERKLAQTA